jgi:hypothetical protein
VNGVLESAKCHAPSGRLMAMRMSEPGVRSVCWWLAEVGGRERKREGGKGKWEEEKINARNLGTTPPGLVLSEAKGDILEAI